MLRDPSLAQFCPAERSLSNVGYYANVYDTKQLGNPIGVALATNRLTHAFRRYMYMYMYTGNIPKVLITTTLRLRPRE